MPRVRILLESDDGQPLGSLSEQVYPLNSSCSNLPQIEASVEAFKKAALPCLEAQLLNVAQRDALEREKKDSDGVVTEPSRSRLRQSMAVLGLRSNGC